MKIFSNNIDKKLENIYIPKFLAEGNTLIDSKKIFIRLLRIIKKESKLEKTSNLPVNFGDIILSNSLNNDKAKAFVEDLRKEGVKDEDIKWWWNMHDLERRIIEKIDGNVKIVAFVNNRNKGMSEGKAAESVRKLYPIYGDPKDISQTAGDDRPLPDELRNRVDVYIEKRSKVNPEKYKKEIEESTTFNSWLRSEIRKGNL